MASSKKKPSPREEQLQRVAARLKLSRFMDSNKPVTWSDEVVAGHSKAVKELRDAIPEDSSILNEFTPEAVQKIRQEKQAIPISLETVGVKPVENPERLTSSEITSSNPGIDPSKYLETNEDAIRSRFVLSTDARGFTTASYQDPNPISTAQVSIGPRIEYKQDGVPIYLGHRGTFSVKTNNSSRTDMNQILDGCGPNCDKTYEYRGANSTDWGPSLVAHQDQEAHLSRVIDDAVKNIALYHRGLLGEKNTYGFDSGEYYRGRAKKAQEQQASSGATAEFTNFQDKYEKTVAGIDSSGKPNGIEDEDWKSLDANQKAIVAKFAQHHDDYVGSTVDDAGAVHLTLDQYELSHYMAEKLHKLEHSFGWQDSGYEWHHGDLELNDHDTDPYHRVVLKQNLPIITRMSTLLKNYKFANLLSKDNDNPSLESSQLREGTPLPLPSSSEQPAATETVNTPTGVASSKPTVEGSQSPVVESTSKGAPVGEGEAFTQPSFVSPQPLEECAFCHEKVPGQAAHTLNDYGICSKATTYLAAPGYHKDSRDSWLSQVGIDPESGELHINGEIRANNARGTLNNEKNQAETESGSNVSAQMTEAGVAPGQTPENTEEPAQQSTEEPQTASYSGPGSVEYANKEDAPASGGVMPDGSAPTWKDVHVAIINGTRRGSTPGAKRYIKKVAPDLGGHVLDISDTFYAIQNHPNFTPEAKQSSIDEIKSNAQPIYDWLKGKAESTPDEVATGLPRSLRQDNMIETYRMILDKKNAKVDESTGLTKEAQDIYDQSVTFANRAKEEEKLGPRDVRYENRTRINVDSRGGSYGTSRSDMSSEQYESWVAEQKAKGSVDAGSLTQPMSSEDLAAQKKSASESRTKSVRVPKAGSSYSSTLPKEQRFDTDLRPTNVDKDHWTALKTYHPEAAAFVSMYAHKWHNLVDSGTIAPEGKMSTGETPRYTVDQLKSDKQAVLNMFSPRMAGAVYSGANTDKQYKLAPLVSKTKGYGLVDTDHDAADRINHILRAYPMPE